MPNVITHSVDSDFEAIVGSRLADVATDGYAIIADRASDGLLPAGAELLTPIDAADARDLGALACLQGDGTSVDDSTVFVHD